MWSQYPFYSDFLKEVSSEWIQSELAFLVNLNFSVFRDCGTGKRREMGKDVVEQGSTWKSYEKAKLEMREERKWEECIIICLLWIPNRDRFSCSSLMQALGQRKRERSGGRSKWRDGCRWCGRTGLEAGFAGSMWLGNTDWKIHKENIYMYHGIRNIHGELGNETNLNTALYWSWQSDIIITLDQKSDSSFISGILAQIQYK